MSFRIGFAGTPAFAATALQAMVAAGEPAMLVLTRPDTPKGRGLKLEPSPVKTLALAHGIPVFQPASLRSPQARGNLLEHGLDVLVVAAYGLILPPEVLRWPLQGAINIHASRLPRWRGAAPIQRALLAGDASTGVTIMQMDEGLDTGPVIETVDVPIAPDDTTATLHEKLASTGADAIVRTLRKLRREGAIEARPQPSEGASYARKIERGEAVIDWSQQAAQIERQVRAFEPSPGAATVLDGVPVKVRRATLNGDCMSSPAGTVLRATASGIDVACGSGTLRILEVQPAGGRRMPVAAFLAGHTVRPGMQFSVAAGAEPAATSSD